MPLLSPSRSRTLLSSSTHLQVVQGVPAPFVQALHEVDLFP